MMPLLLATSDRFAHHQTPPGHAERPERNDAMQVVAARWRERGASLIEPAFATDEQLRRVHTDAYLEQIAATAGHAVMLDPDTFTSSETWDIARLAAGASVGAVAAVLEGTAARAAALVRPPGHHAEPGRAMGFCLLNNVAIAAAEALARGVARVAIVDFDVHHCNGTQAAFLTDPRVLVVSTHQWPYYPGTGHEADAGAGAGEGYTVNVPIEAGATDADYDLIFREVVVPVVAQFNPELVLVSAGYDAHELDPLGGMRMTAIGFGRLAGHLVGLADRCASGRMVLVTEGGYHLPSLVESLDASLLAMDRSGAEADADQGSPLPAGGTTARGLDSCTRVRAVQSQYWRGL